MSYKYDRRTHKLLASVCRDGKNYEIIARHLGELKRRISALTSAGWKIA